MREESREGEVLHAFHVIPIDSHEQNGKVVKYTHA